MSSFRKILFGLFFASGFCGLLYQVIWLRLAFAHFGIITPVLSVVVSVFMLGLSLGSWAAGAWVARTPQRTFSAIYAYALTEGLIGLGAFVVPKLYPLGGALLLPGGEMNSVSYLFLSALVITLSLLPWCVLMGATFPLMMAFIKEREGASETSFSFLYLANVIGAMCGTILTANVLVELLGFHRTLMVAGAVNFLIAGVSLILARQYPHSSSVKASGLKDFISTLKEAPAVPVADKGWAYVVLFTTGFTSMSLEVVWVRDFTTVLGTTVYAFALIVAIYLLATWLGSALYRTQSRRGPSIPQPILIAALAVASLFPIAVNDPRFNLRQTGVIIGIFPFSFLLGYLTPQLIDRYSGGDPDRAGTAYAVNIVGCILGPLLASYLFLPYLGAKGSMLLMAVPYTALMIAAWRRLESPYWKWPCAGLTVVLLVCGLFVNRSYEEQYPGGIVRRDATATVISVGEGMQRRLLVNGMGITQLTTITKVMAHLPLAMIRPKPTTALDICFGMGTTYRSLMRWDDVQVTAVELVPSVKEAFGFYHADAAQVMANPRGHVVIDDGRRFLSRTQETFDVITIDPPPPIEAAGSSLLYATEFYEMIQKRLKPGGVLQQWFPGGPGVECQAILRSLTQVFPYVRTYASIEGWGIHYFASMQPIQMPSAKECVDRMSKAARLDLVEWESNKDPVVLMKRVLAREIPIENLLAGDGRVTISDDRPFNEYYWLRRSWARYQREHSGGTYGRR